MVERIPYSFYPLTTTICHYGATINTASLICYHVMAKITIEDPDLMNEKKVDSQGRLYLGRDWEDKLVEFIIVDKTDVGLEEGPSNVSSALEEAVFEATDDNGNIEPRKLAALLKKVAADIEKGSWEP